MRRILVRTSVALAVVAIACTNPTGDCSCTPLTARVIVRGEVLDAGGAPVRGARVALDGVPASLSVDPPGTWGSTVLTGVDGRFRTYAGTSYTGTGIGSELALRAVVVRAGSSDTVRLRPGMARFRDAAFDSVHV